MANYLKISVGILFILCASRFIPHPPNFTSVIALSFYVPALLGRKFIPILLISFVFTDLIIGLHKITFYTWGSIVVIGLVANFLSSTFYKRVLGSVFGAIIFYIISNFGVWTMGSYGYDLKGLIACYIFAIPFFGFTLLSTIIYSMIIESIVKIFKNFNLLKIRY